MWFQEKKWLIWNFRRKYRFACKLALKKSETGQKSHFVVVMLKVQRADSTSLISCCRIVLFFFRDTILQLFVLCALAGFEILGNLCKAPCNRDSLLVSLDDSVFRIALCVLTIGDVELVLASLESLYVLSQLGEETCTKTILVPGSVGEWELLACVRLV